MTMRNMRKRIISSSSWASHSGLSEGFQVRGDGWAVGEVRGPGWGDPWRLSCGQSFKLVDLSFPGKISPSPCLCLSPALLLNQGEWTYFQTLGVGQCLKFPSRSGLRQVAGVINLVEPV